MTTVTCRIARRATAFRIQSMSVFVPYTHTPSALKMRDAEDEVVDRLLGAHRQPHVSGSPD